MRRAPALALALACLLLALLAPIRALELTSYERAAAASIVADGSAYNAVTVPSCSLLGVTGGTCSFTIANKGAVEQYYNLSEDPNGAEVTRYKIGTSAWQTSGRVMAPAPVGVGSSVTATADIGACIACGTRTATFTLEGEKAGFLNSIETRVKLTIVFT